MTNIELENQQNRMQEAAATLVKLANQQFEAAKAAGRDASAVYYDPDISGSDLLRSVRADMGTKAFDRWEEDVLNGAAQQADLEKYEAEERAKYLAAHNTLDGFDDYFDGAEDWQAPVPKDESVPQPPQEAPRPAFLSAPNPDDDDGYLDEVVQQDIRATNQRIDRYVLQFTDARARQATGRVSQRPTTCAVSGQTAGAQHKTTGGSDDDPASEPPAVTIIAPVAPENIEDTPQYLARRATLARAKKLAELAAKGHKYKDMDLTPGPAGNCDAGIGHESILPTLSRFMVDPDPLDQIIPDPHKAAAEVPGPDGKSQQRPYHRYLRKSILTQKNPAATPAQKMLADKYHQMALPGLVAVIKTTCRKLGLRGVDVDGVAQHVMHRIFEDTRFEDQPNVDVPTMLESQFLTIDKAITYANFSLETGSHQDASRYTDRPDVADDDDGDSGNRRLEKAAFRARRDEHMDETPEDRLRAGIILDRPAAEAALGVDRFMAHAEDHDETNAERRARQTAEELRAINLKHKLLDGLRGTPDHERNAAIAALAAHLVQHPEPLLLTLLQNDVARKKSKKSLDPLVVELVQAVTKATRLAKVEALFVKPVDEAPTLDLHSALIQFASLPQAEARERAPAVMSGLCELQDDTAQHVKGHLQARAFNKNGKFPADVQQGAKALLDALAPKGGEK
ncbi:hypothetical protein HF290_03040 [Acidithiobacillus ferrooxidans]|uniref:hypothetical protein n=1 Tax=Acidithiobacillus ferrooxidans TaxID=920 RepID=UPI001C06875D|nr:hypothetical protein [Acidithiobacillus ferrooxidans]MBU2859423.1 hypothetical protein [Acidithiobacillus ferrooxidans]